MSVAVLVPVLARAGCNTPVGREGGMQRGGARARGVHVADERRRRQGVRDGRGRRG